MSNYAQNLEALIDKYPPEIPLSDVDKRLVGRALCDVQGELSTIFQFVKDDPSAADMRLALTRSYDEINIIIKNIKPDFEKAGE